MKDVSAITERQDAWRRDAMASDAVAREAAAAALSGVVEAAGTLLENLAELEYPRVRGARHHKRGKEARIQAVEARLAGPLPPALRLYWQIVGELSFVDFESYRHATFWTDRGVRGPKGYCDAVFLHDCDIEWIQFTTQDYGDLSEPPAASAAAVDSLPLSADGYHKDNISGGDSYEMRIGESWLQPLLNFEWAGALRPASAPPDPPDLIGYLRTSLLECAGFPGLYGVPEFEPVREYLLRGVRVF
jgi:hypothetical protein